jgi:hypothetical protein
LVSAAGLEPAVTGIKIRRLGQLGDAPKNLVMNLVMNLVLPTGVQPAKSSVESAVPLAPGDGRLVRAAGIEPNTSCLEDRHAAHYATPARMEQPQWTRRARCSVRPALSILQDPIDRDGIAHRLRVMAESTGIEPVRPEGLDALAPRCLTARPTLQFKWRARLDSNQHRAV